MRKVLVDTCVWVDIALRRPQFVNESLGAVMACLEDDIEVVTAATSLKDVFYFAEQSRDAEAGYAAVDGIMHASTLAPVDALVCEKAKGLERPDFEDGIIAACALVEQADAIVTRDEAAFAELGIAKLSPAQLLARLGYEAIEV